MFGLEVGNGAVWEGAGLASCALLRCPAAAVGWVAAERELASAGRSWLGLVSGRAP